MRILICIAVVAAVLAIPALGPRRFGPAAGDDGARQPARARMGPRRRALCRRGRARRLGRLRAGSRKSRRRRPRAATGQPVPSSPPGGTACRSESSPGCRPSPSCRRATRRPGRSTSRSRAAVGCSSRSGAVATRPHPRVRYSMASASATCCRCRRRATRFRLDTSPVTRRKRNPDGGLIDSNPYGLLALPGHRLVTDAGGNSLLDVSANGDVTTVATFPKAPVPGPVWACRDAVPRAVVVGPDGAYYVSTLTGFPFTAGTASVYRVVPGQAPTLYAWNLTALTDLAFGPDGSLYALQHASPISGSSVPVRRRRRDLAGAAGRRLHIDAGRRRPAPRDRPRPRRRRSLVRLCQRRDGGQRRGLADRTLR